jgi:hypothetical protein
MYPDLLSGEPEEIASQSTPQLQASVRPDIYPSLGDSSVDELERFLDDESAPESSKITETVYPANIAAYSDESFRCLWCERTLYGKAQLEEHLEGNEHTRKCVNSDIPPYGSADHFEKVADYVNLYGHNVYARLKEWPECISEKATDWKCELCNKHFQTQSGVSAHLKSSSHTSKLEIGYASLSESLDADMSGEDIPNWPACIQEDGLFWKCTFCDKKFNSVAQVDSHLQHPKHAANILGTPTKRSHSPSKSIDHAVVGENHEREEDEEVLVVRRLAEEKERKQRLSIHVNFDDRSCRMCRQRFGSLKETEDHVTAFEHLANYLDLKLLNIL